RSGLHVLGVKFGILGIASCLLLKVLVLHASPDGQAVFTNQRVTTLKAVENRRKNAWEPGIVRSGGNVSHRRVLRSGFTRGDHAVCAGSDTSSLEDCARDPAIPYPGGGQYAGEKHHGSLTDLKNIIKPHRIFGRI